MANLSAFYGPNAGYVLELYERYQQDPASVDAATRAFFADNPPGELAAPRAPAMAPPEAGTLASRLLAPVAENTGRVSGAAALAQAIRERGYLAAKIDPLGSPPPGDPQMERAAHGVTDADLAQLPASVVGGPAARGAASALDAIRNLRRIYCASTGYDCEHIHDAEERAWLREAAESGRFRLRMNVDDRRQLLDRLTQVEAFERFIHRSFPGQKRFSIEGADMLVPILDQVIHCQTQRGNREVMLGMAHRGRLNVLAHLLEKPYSAILSEFEHTAQRAAATPSDTGGQGWTGDVKYHLGARWPSRTGAVVQVAITLTPNPSHLEFVNPVVEGMARAAQDRCDQPGPPRQDLEAALAILIHGDAAFPGEGIVAETLNLSRLPGYQTGGTIHLILNNQIGFTTLPAEGRSTLYASDLAKGFEIPIVHVNADDPEACLASAKLACAYRDRFHKDFLIDLVGYRRWGHNEGDEPAFTQPLMYQIIQSHPTVREVWAQTLERDGTVPREAAEQMLQAAFEPLEEARRETQAPQPEEAERENGLHGVTCSAAAPPETLRAYNEALMRLPDGFTLNPRLERILERRLTALSPPAAPDDAKDGQIDWAHAESLAFATILAHGIPIRFTGQDVERGTFSQRHLVLHDAHTGKTFTPLQALPDARASFALYNSPLSENAVLGFEYGYTVQSPAVLVLWEAQFGDFANAAQVIIDQFIASAQAKWRQTPGLVLLLPHAYEGQGPEHSSARLERYLQLAANDNLRIVNCTTAAQYFHLLRDQASRLAGSPRPLVVMTPKSLLRHAVAASTLEDLTRGGFRPVLTDPTAQPERVRRLLLCSGKVYYDLTVGTAGARPDTTAVVRVEELYPVPKEDLERVLAAYPNLEEVTWVQEEPQNMGAWSFMAACLREMLPDGLSLRYAGRPPRASPAEGHAELFAAEQSRIVAEALSSPPSNHAAARPEAGAVVLAGRQRLASK